MFKKKCGRYSQILFMSLIQHLVRFITGGAVDITLVDLEGNELDMGTTFDFFGKEAHHAYQGFSSEVLSNRKLLKETMEKHGFLSITSEWWHYNLKALSRATVANFKWNCDI